jgi:hypothetical protein
MNGLSTIRARRLAGTAALGGRWLLAWTCVLILLLTIALAAERALASSSWFADAAQQVGQVPTLATPSTSADTAVMLSSVDGAGKRLNVVCLTTQDRVSADVLAINPEDMAAVVANLCKPPTEAVMQPGIPV